MADGVGGWREYGVDPSQVPKTIMSLCARLVDNGKFSASSPEQLLERAYDEASMHKDAVMGKCTFSHIISILLTPSRPNVFVVQWLTVELN